MLSLGLSRADRLDFERLQGSSHRLQTKIQLLDLNHNYIGDISTMLLEGSVTIDAKGEVTRQSSAAFLDPNGTIRLDSHDPDEGAMFMDRMLKAWHVLIEPDGSNHYVVPLFCGPLTNVQRNGPFLSVEAQGKELLAMPSVWRFVTYAKGLLKSTVIERIMRDLCGETRLDIIERTDKLPTNLSITMEDSPWIVAKKLAASMGCQLFYDARGVCRMRVKPTKSVYLFSDTREVTGNPQFDYEHGDIKNAVRVVGAKPKGAKERIVVRVVADKSHPLSPWNIGRTDAPRYLVETIEDDSINSRTEALAIAKKQLRLRLLEAMQTSFDSKAVRHLEPNDVCRLSHDDAVSEFRFSQATIPLLAGGGPMSVGYLKNVSVNKKTIRRNKR